MGEFSTRIDMTGQKIHKWTVLGFSHIENGHDAYWLCQCECGNIVSVHGRSLRKGLSKSCGCIIPEITSRTHRITHKIVDGIEYKACSHCKRELTLDNFNKSSNKWDGLSQPCKECASTRRKSTPRNKEYFRNWANSRYKTDIHFRIRSSIQARIRSAVKNNYKYYHTDELLGCSIKELKEHLENQFTSGMSWDNYGQWHIDHIVPCAVFDLSKASEQKKCFHYSNLQPLWKADNIRKKDKIL